MSDGALSQAEIDALLLGVDSSSLGGAAKELSGDDGERKALQKLLNDTCQNQSNALSTMAGSDVVLSDPSISFMNRDRLVELLPDMVVAVKADFSSGFPGDHLFIIGEDTAKSLATMINKEENIELDTMSLSMIGEVASQLVGTQITALTKATNNTAIASVSPEATNVPKALVALPGETFPCVEYDLDLGNGQHQKLWEVYGANVSHAIGAALNGSAASAKKTPAAAQQQPAIGAGMQGMGMPMGGMMPMGGGMSGMGSANVQAVQFPNLMTQVTSQEQANIALIMDVYMEMTVELGRTKKLIKEILGMGEGTIIELDKLAGEPVDILVNHKLIAKGEVVVIDENFGVRVTEIVSPTERMSGMA
ncbi:MAG: flagellar motor switch protein FliN [Treponema sp.]|jgi:flagellar motor switch protein FliN/FliY|nr:flagellar motor switch protein FliN [Treponema sp.]